jgi:hypothetical protein
VLRLDGDCRTRKRLDRRLPLKRFYDVPAVLPVDSRENIGKGNG